MQTGDDPVRDPTVRASNEWSYVTEKQNGIFYKIKFGNILFPISNGMIVLGIDPGYERVGVAILDCGDGIGRERLLFSCCLMTSSKKEFSARLGEIGKNLQEIIEKYAPNDMAIENIFFQKNKKTAMRVSEAKGAIIETAVRNGMKVQEYTPLQIKQAVTGHGTSDKKQVEHMVRLLIGLRDGNIMDDEVDAIAVGLTHNASRSSF